MRVQKWQYLFLIELKCNFQKVFKKLLLRILNYIGPNVIVHTLPLASVFAYQKKIAMSNLINSVE